MQVNVAPPGVVSARVTELVFPVTVLPPRSWIATLGCVPNGTFVPESLGCCVNPSFAAAPTEIVNELLTAEASAPSVAVSVYVPARSIVHPANVDTPATAALGFAVQVNAAPAGVVIARVTLLVSVVTVFPLASWTVTTGWFGENATPPVELLGEVVNASLEDTPATML